jgi:hypothetical protein
VRETHKCGLLFYHRVGSGGSEEILWGSESGLVAAQVNKPGDEILIPWVDRLGRVTLATGSPLSNPEDGDGKKQAEARVWLQVKCSPGSH